MRNTATILSEEEKLSLISDYENGKPEKYLMNKYHIHRNSLRKFLRENDIKLRNPLPTHLSEEPFDPIGLKYNSFTILNSRKNGGGFLWKVRCECGEELEIARNKVYNGLLKQCNGIKCSKLTLKGEQHPLNRSCGRITGSRWSGWRNNAEKRNIPFELTIEEGWRLFVGQNQKCNLSGITLNFKFFDNSEQTASLDRKDSSKGYTLENSQWIHKEINIMKRSLHDDEFILFCDCISEYQKEKRKQQTDEIVNRTRKYVFEKHKL